MLLSKWTRQSGVAKRKSTGLDKRKSRGCFSQAPVPRHGVGERMQSPANYPCQPPPHRVGLLSRHVLPSLSLTVVIIPGWHGALESVRSVQSLLEKYPLEHPRDCATGTSWQGQASPRAVCHPFPTDTMAAPPPEGFTWGNLWLWLWNLLESLLSKADQTGLASTFVSVPRGCAAKKATPTAIWGAPSPPAMQILSLGLCLTEPPAHEVQLFWFSMKCLKGMSTWQH